MRPAARRRALRLLLALLPLALAARLPAHESRPGYLAITETAPQRYQVLWKQPTLGEVALRLMPHVVLAGTAADWLAAPPDQAETGASFALQRWSGLVAPTLDGARVEVEGLDTSITDVLVRVELRDGRGTQQLLRASRPALRLEFSARRTEFSWSYFGMGVLHILTGADHLLFVFGLMLLVQGAWRLVRTITAFTVAHSLTLAATALGWISVHYPLIEALVALSIVILAVELAHQQRGERLLAARYPWLIAFTFGLLHGCAFAGALREVGLPEHAVIPALLLFNLGVEAGQLLFIAVVGGILWALRRLPWRWPTAARWVAPYAIGSCAVVWMLQRLVEGT